MGVAKVESTATSAGLMGQGSVVETSARRSVGLAGVSR